MGLKEMIAAEKARREAAAKAEENPAASILDVVAEDENADKEVSLVERQFTVMDYPYLDEIADKIEQMGCNLKTVSEEGSHVWVLRNHSVQIIPSRDLVTVQTRFNSGSLYQDYVAVINNEETKNTAIKEIAKAVLIEDDAKWFDEYDKKKSNWERSFGRKEGSWSKS